MRGLVLALGLGLLTPMAALAQPASAPDVRASLTRLHDELHLDAAQEHAWTEYLAAIAPDAQSEARREAAERMMPSLPTPRRIALMQANLAQEEADLRREGTAVIAFYNQLRADQQHTFDRVTLPREAGDGR